jgi:hypothetical protein
MTTKRKRESGEDICDRQQEEWESCLARAFASVKLSKTELERRAKLEPPDQPKLTLDDVQDPHGLLDGDSEYDSSADAEPIANVD